LSPAEIRAQLDALAKRAGYNATAMVALHSLHSTATVDLVVTLDYGRGHTFTVRSSDWADLFEKARAALPSLRQSAPVERAA